MSSKSDLSANSHEALKYHWTYWKITGVIPFGRFRTLFIPYSICFNTIVTAITPITLIISYFFEDNLKVILSNLSETISMISCALKHFTVIVYHQQIYTIKEILRKLDQRVIQDDEKRLLKDAIKFSHRIFISFNVVAYTAFGSYILSSAIFRKRLVYTAWFPFDMSVPGYFWFAFTYQAIAVIFMGFEDISVDMISVTYLSVLVAQIQALGLRIRRIGTDPGTSKEENYNVLINCINEHKVILQLFEEIKILISRTLSIQLLITAFALCIAAVYLLFFSTELFGIIGTIMYLAAVILEVLPACYCANQLMDYNEGLTGAIFSCNWLDQDRRFKKTIIIFMQRTQKNLVVLAWNIIPISLPTFLGIVKFSFSMFTILSQLNK